MRYRQYTDLSGFARRGSVQIQVLVVTHFGVTLRRAIGTGIRSMIVVFDDVMQSWAGRGFRM